MCILGLAASSALTTEILLGHILKPIELADLHDELILANVAIGIKKTSPNYYWQFEVQT